MSIHNSIRALAGLAAAAVVAAGAGPAEYWPQWRGPEHVGRSSTAKGLPLQWSQTENVLWRVSLPSWSAATPIVWGDVVFITSAEEGFLPPPRSAGRGPGGRGAAPGAASGAEHDKLFLIALNRKNGEILWKRQTGTNNRLYRKQNLASPSPVTDGAHVWTMTGSGFLTCFDFQGKTVWQREIQKDYGEFGLNHGYASSPKLHENRLYVQVLHGNNTDDPSYVFAVDKKTGKTIWKVDRPTDAPRESPDNYATPILVPVNSKLQLVVSGGDYVTGHDIDTGKELWRLGGFNPDGFGANRTISSSISIGGIVYTSNRDGKPFVAFRAGGSGDITGKAEVWKNNLGADVPTPTTDGKRIYVVNDRGIVSALDAKTGDVIWDRQRIEPGTYSASPLLAEGRIYATSEDGTTSVLQAGGAFEVLAVNKLDDFTLASPVAAGNQLFIRTMQYLYCIGQK